MEYKEDITQILKNINSEDFLKTVDLHCHTIYSDGKNTPDEMLEMYEQKGYKMVAIADHNTFEAYKNIKKSYDLKLINAIEFDCWHGYVFMHILGYGVDFDSPELQKLCAKNKWETEKDIVRIFPKRSAKEVIKAINLAGGIAVLAHPCCCWSFNIKNTIKQLKTLGLQGVEVYYEYKRHRKIIKFYNEKNIENIANELNLIKTGGSDAHCVK